MKNKFIYLFLFLMTFVSCKDQVREDLIGSNHYITFNEIKLGRFTFKIPDGPFNSGDDKSGIIKFNSVRDGNDIKGGFILSNKNYRSYPWSLSEDYNVSASAQMKKDALDSCRFSVYTSQANKNSTYAVAKVVDDLAFFELQTPDVVEAILVANTTYNFLLMNYGSYWTSYINDKTQYCEQFIMKVNPADPNGDLIFDLDKDGNKRPALVSNPRIPDVNIKGRFSLPTLDGQPIMRLNGVSYLEKLKKAKESVAANKLVGASAAKILQDSLAAWQTEGAGYYKLIIKGYLNGTQVGTIDYYMGARTNAIKELPKLNTIKEEWYAVNLKALGMVDKIIFNLDSSDKDSSGKMRTPPYFCLDGIVLQNRVSNEL